LLDTLKVLKLVTIDPVNDKPAKGAHTPIESNVSHFVNYYQDHGDVSSIALFDLQTHRPLVRPDPHSAFFKKGFGFTGDPMPAVTAVQKDEFQVDFQLAGQKSAHEYFATPTSPVADHRWGEMLGRQVNHTTIPFWTYSRAIDALS